MHTHPFHPPPLDRLQVHKGVDFDIISELTDGFSGSDLKELCQTACRRATMDFAVELSRIPQQNTSGLENEETKPLLEPWLKPVRMEDFVKALEHVHKTGGYFGGFDDKHPTPQNSPVYPPEQHKMLRTLANMLLS